MTKPKPEPKRDHDVTQTEFERLVEAALKVDPKGLSGKHKNEATPKARKPKKG
jgi:hypothetical protein